MFRIAHCSDLHFGKALPLVTQALLDDLKAQEPDLIIISGDLTQRARQTEFIEAAAFLKALNQPFLVIPGNHDLPLYNLIQRFTRPFQNYQRYISKDLSQFFVNNEVAILGVDSTSAYRWKSSVISAKQKTEISNFFRNHPNQYKILVTHHPLFPIAKLKNLLYSADIDMLLSGHLHQSKANPISVGIASAQKKILMVQAGTATSSRCRTEMNAYNLIDLHHGKVSIQVRGFQNKVFTLLEQSHF